MQTQVIPTRQELNKQKKKLLSARKGHKLLKDKRDELMRQYMDLVQENMSLRLKVEAGIRTANAAVSGALAGMSEKTAQGVFLIPGQELQIQCAVRTVMSVTLPVLSLHRRSPDEGAVYCYGLASTTGELDAAVDALAKIQDDMIQLAEIEKSCRLLSAEIEKTRRRVNALEYVVIPQAQYNIKFIRMKLDENERSNQVRLMKIKDRL